MRVKLSRIKTLLVIFSALILVYFNVVPLVITITAWFIFIFCRFGLSIYRQRDFVDNLTLFFLSLYFLFNIYPTSIEFTYFNISPSDIEDSLRNSFLVILIIALLLELSSNLRKQSIIINRFKENISLSHGKIKLFFARIILAGLGIYTLYVISSIGLSTYFENMRKEGGAIFFVGNQYFQILLIPVSVYILAYNVYNEHSVLMKKVNVIVVCFFWFMYILSGARKELFIFCVSIVGLGIINIKQHKWGLIIGSLLLLSLGFFREGIVDFERLIVVFHEYIFPQYVQFIAEHLINEYDTSLVLEKSNLFNGVNAMFPSFLRINEYKGLGSSLLDSLSYIPLGIGAHPLGEAILNFGKYGYLVFILVFFFCYNLIFLIAKNGLPELLIIAIGYFSIIGRSDLWLSVFFLSYSSFFMFLMCRNIKIDGKNSVYDNN